MQENLKLKTYRLTKTMPISDEILYLSKSSFSLGIIILSEIPGLIFLNYYFDRNLILYSYTLLIVCLFFFSTLVTLTSSFKIWLQSHLSSYKYYSRNFNIHMEITRRIQSCTSRSNYSQSIPFPSCFDIFTNWHLHFLSARCAPFPDKGHPGIGGMI